MCPSAVIWLPPQMGQAMVTFQQAYEAAAARYAPEVWADLSPDLRIKAIYEEMRRLDLRPLP